MFKRRDLILFLILIPVLLSSCDLYIGKVCTAEFRVIGVAVSTVDNEPVILDELTITTKRFRQETTLDVCGNGYDCDTDGPAGWPEEGIYTIFHDGMKSAIRQGSIEIKAAGKNEKVQFEEEFVISSDGCHVSKEAGPDTIFVNMN